METALGRVALLRRSLTEARGCFVGIAANGSSLRVCVLTTYRIDHQTSAARARGAFATLFKRRLLIRGSQGDMLEDDDRMILAHCPGEGFGTAVQLHDGMTPEEALLLLRAVLGVRVDTVETLGRSPTQIARGTGFDPPGLPKAG